MTGDMWARGHDPDVCIIIAANPARETPIDFDRYKAIVYVIPQKSPSDAYNLEFAKGMLIKYREHSTKFYIICDDAPHFVPELINIRTMHPGKAFFKVIFVAHYIGVVLNEAM